MNKFEQHIQGNKPVLVDFYADWCGPCKMMAPSIVDVKQKIGERAIVLKMDIDKNPAYASRYNIQSIPTLIIFRKGEILWRQMGVVPAATILKQLESFC
ncbi:MAG: thioredoxin [Chitinophagaceae bacterium]|nr:thioredoxin [Bacteroidota bacterium]MCC6259157.1 thioredoxin [Chitinophagaceae bacterium]MCW5916306.1 thioredoxin [Ferruginibacter sp.]